MKMQEKYKIIDSHAHYDDDAFNEDRDAVLNQIRENGVVQVLNCAASYNSLKTTDKLTKDYDFIVGALGIHPWECWWNERRYNKGNKEVY